MAKRKKNGGASVVSSSYKYKTTRIRDKSGKVRHSANNGDAIAKAMLVHGAKGGTVSQIIKANSLNVKTKGRNAGLVRMSVGVALRGLVRNDSPVKIGSLTVKSLKQLITVPKVEFKTPVRGQKAKKKSAPRRRQIPARRVEDVPASASV